ncbi:MAG: phosphatidylcholine/phosphatidylserine synthase [Planctomycetaceae bacterium]|nr:phosphatidylcholine/phosphatidylserine synthase [Planctomycetaceae bacterium]
MRSGGQRAFAVLPTVLTLSNAACGFGAITFAAKVGPVETSAGVTDLRSLWISAFLIFLAMVFDALDGRAARWAKQSSEFGAQLDSLCDALSFGAAPAFLMLQFVRHFEVRYDVPFDYHPRLLWVIAVLFVVCAILRLARFNVETDDEDSHDHFSGLPSPAAAGTVASFPLAIGDLIDLAGRTGSKGQPIAAFLVPTVQIALPLITLAVACLMVSRIRYVHLFNQLFSGRRSRRHLIQLVFGGAVVFLLKELAVPVLFCYFAFASPLRAAWDSRHRLGKRAAPGHTD